MIYASINFWVIIAIVAAILVALIVVYLITKKGKYKHNLKKREKKIEKANSKLSQDELEQLISDIFQDKKYKGTLNSFESKNKKSVKVFLKKFVEKVCPYTIVKEKFDTKKYKNVGIILTKNQNPDRKIPKKRRWVYDYDASVNKNVNRLVKVINKNKVARGTVDVLSRVYRHYKDKDAYPETPQTFENNLYITYFDKK
ncbi:MAG: hypothetical protein K6G38_02995 [Gammaproteobacteria bacterium]|nr:hypothetical protein [Gammaproteobacteria bacterium]